MEIAESTDPSANLTQHAVAGTAWSSVATVAKQLLSVASVATVARLLGPSAYGVMGMANLLIVFIVYFKDLGTGSAIVQRSAITNLLLSSLFWVNFFFGLTLSLLLCAASPAAAAFFKTPELVPILCVLAFSFWLSCCGVVQNSLLIRRMNFRTLAKADITAAVAAYLVALTFALLGFGVWSLVFASVANSLTTVVAYWIGSGWRPSREFDTSEIRSIAGFSLNLSGFGLVNYFSRNADNITVGKVLGRAPLGDYQMAYNLMLTPIQNISSVIAQSTFPAFARIQNDNERFRLAYTRSTMLIALITFPVMAGLGIVADPMIRTVLGVKWLGAIRIFQVLAPVGLVQSVQTTVGQIYMAKGRTDWMFRWGIIQGCILVLAFLVGVRFGVLGVAIAYTAAYLGVTMIPSFLIPFKLIGLKLTDYARAMMPQILITGLMVLVCWLWMSAAPHAGIVAPWMLLTSTVLLGAAVYVFALLLTWPSVMQHLERAMAGANKPSITRILARMRRFSVRERFGSI